MRIIDLVVFRLIPVVVDLLSFLPDFLQFLKMLSKVEAVTISLRVALRQLIS